MWQNAPYRQMGACRRGSHALVSAQSRFDVPGVEQRNPQIREIADVARREGCACDEAGRSDHAVLHSKRVTRVPPPGPYVGVDRSGVRIEGQDLLGELREHSIRGPSEIVATPPSRKEGDARMNLGHRDGGDDDGLVNLMQPIGHPPV